MKLSDSLNKNNTLFYSLNFLLAFIILALQFFIITFFNKIPFILVLLDSICIGIIYIITIFSNINTTITSNAAIQNLNQIKLYNQSLKTLHDSERAFKHDFSNIIQAMGGYIMSNDIDGLKIYYSQLFSDCQKLNTLYSLTPELVNEPAIYSLLSSKYYRANKLGVTINLNVLFNLDEINMKIYEFTRILGILMDNAIEAASDCKEKIVNIEFRKDTSRNRQLLIVENTYLEKNIDTERIFEKGFSSKPNNTGLGLWEIRQILRKNKHLNLYTNKDKKYFKQQLEIYYVCKSKTKKECLKS